MTSEKWYKFFFYLGFVSLVDILTRRLIEPYTGSPDEGVVAYGIGIPVSVLLGANAGAWFVAVIGLVTGFCVIYFILAWYFRQKSKKNKESK